MNLQLESMLVPEFWKTLVALLGLRAWGVLKILVLFYVVRYLAYRVIVRVMKSLSARADSGSSAIDAARVRTLCSLVESVTFYVLIFIAGVMILREFQVDPTPVLTAAGVVGLAVGFGAQKLVKDIISGFFIVLENQYSVGEYVTIGTTTGTVQELGMRITRLRDDIGKLVIIPNGDIGQVVNHSRGPIQATLEVSVTPDSDLAKVRAAIDAAGVEITSGVEGILTAPKSNGVTLIDGCKMTIRVSGDVRPGRQDAVQTALREAIREKFQAEGIKLV